MGQQEHIDVDDIMSSVMSHPSRRLNAADGHELLKPKMKKRKIMVKKKILVMIIAVSILVAGGISAFTKFQHNSFKFPKEIASSVNFTLYYPRHLPAGFSLKQDSLKILDNDTVTYIFNYDSQKEMTITEQAMPANFQSTILTNTKDVENKLGKGYVGTYGNHPVGIITTKKTLIFINDPTNTD